MSVERHSWVAARRGIRWAAICCYWVVVPPVLLTGTTFACTAQAIIWSFKLNEDGLHLFTRITNYLMHKYEQPGWEPGPYWEEAGPWEVYFLTLMYVPGFLVAGAISLLAFPVKQLVKQLYARKH